MEQLTAQRRRLLIVLAVLGMATYLTVAIAADAQPLRAGVQQLGFMGCAAVLALSLLNYLLRFVRWAYYLRLLGHQLPGGRHLLYYLAGFAFTVSPGKAGEALRCLYLKPHGVSYSASLAALFAERLMDVLTMVMLALLLISAMNGGNSAVVLIGGLFTLVTVLAGRPLWPRWLREYATKLSGRWGRVVVGVAATLESSALLLRPAPVSLGLVLGLIAWAGEGYGLYLLADALEVKLNVSLATGIYAVAVLGGVAAFFMPGGLGGMEVAMTALLITAGASLPVAFAIAVLCRLATLWFAVLLGILALLWLEFRPMNPPPAVKVAA